MRRRAGSHFLWIIPPAVVGNEHDEIAVVVDTHRDMGGLRMLAHVGKCLLQDEQDLQLLLGMQRCAIAVIHQQLDFRAGLTAETVDGVIHRLA